MADRWMLFVDGENFTIRAQERAKAEGIELIEGPQYRRNCFYWPGTRSYSVVGWRGEEFRPLRAYYYTSVVGADEIQEEVRESLWRFGFEPQTFKKHQQKDKAKGVDIALTKDMLSHAFRSNYDRAVLVAGDGDYVPLAEEVKRLGKTVEIRFFEDVTSRALRLASDRFVDVTARVVDWAMNQCKARNYAPQPAGAKGE